jgi:MFS family permease
LGVGEKFDNIFVGFAKLGAMVFVEDKNDLLIPQAFHDRFMSRISDGVIEFLDGGDDEFAIACHLIDKFFGVVGLLFACTATLVMIVQPNIYALFVARVLQGIGVGFITGTGTAYLSNLMPQNAKKVAAYVSLTTSLGFSSGALFTNAVLSYNSSLVPFSYWIVFILILGCIGLAIRIPEQATTSTAMIRLPSFPVDIGLAGFAIALAWSMAGIVGVILPLQLVRSGLPNWSGLMLFIIVIAGVIFQPFARRLQAQRSLQLGCILLVLGYLIFTCGAWLGSLGLVLLGVAIAGTACYGFTYLGGLAETVRVGGACTCASSSAG